MQALSRRPLRSVRFRTIRTIGALVLREISMSNGRSLLGYTWDILEPVGSILILTLIMGQLFRSPQLGQNFPLFYASGILPYSFFMDTSARLSNAVRFSRPLLSYPGVTIIDTITARFLVAVITKAVVFSVVLTAIVVIYDLSAFFDYSKVISGVLMALMLGLALGTMNCLLFTYIPLYERVFGILTRPLLLFSAVLYLFETVPLPYRNWLWWNPIIHMVGMVRSGLYPTYKADYVSPTYVAILVAVMLPISLFFIRRYWREILERP